MIRRLIELSPPSSDGKLEAMLNQCVAAGETDEDIPADEDPMKMCAATLESIPNSSNGVRCVAAERCTQKSPQWRRDSASCVAQTSGA